MVLGKGLSGGVYPMSATCITPELEGFFHDRPFIHVSTFGGAEVGCPVALAVLEESSRPEFLAHVRSLAEVFARGFAELREKHIPDYLRNRLDMQSKYLNKIDNVFGREVLARVPEFERDITGLPMIEKMAHAMFGDF